MFKQQGNIKGSRTVKIRLGAKQVRSIVSRGDLSYAQIKGIHQQILRQAKKLFPELAELDRQQGQAWKILEEVRISPELEALDAEFAERKALALKLFNEADAVYRKIQEERRERESSIINQKFQESGITLWETRGRSLQMVEGGQV